LPVLKVIRLNEKFDNEPSFLIRKFTKIGLREYYPGNRKWSCISTILTNNFRSFILQLKAMEELVQVL